jgi:acyl carrier protein
MERSEVLEKVQEVFCDVLGNDDIVLTEATSAQDVDEWTSLAQAQILTAIENELGMRFSLKDIMSIRTVGDIVNAIIMAH